MSRKTWGILALACLTITLTVLSFVFNTRPTTDSLTSPVSAYFNTTQLTVQPQDIFVIPITIKTQGQKVDGSSLQIDFPMEYVDLIAVDTDAACLEHPTVAPSEQFVCTANLTFKAVAVGGATINMRVKAKNATITSNGEKPNSVVEVQVIK